MSVQKSVSLSFDSHAIVLRASLKAHDAALSKINIRSEKIKAAIKEINDTLASSVKSTMSKFIDHVSVTLGRDQKACEAMQKAIRDSQTMIDMVAMGALEKKTVSEYALSAARALHFGIPFETQLKGKPEYTLPWSKSASAKGAPAKGTKAAPKAGTKAAAPTVVNRAELQKTLSIALAQARSLNLDLLAASILDVCLEQFDGFKETILDTKAPM